MMTDLLFPFSSFLLFGHREKESSNELRHEGEYFDFFFSVFSRGFFWEI
jgi:hypothetical protein